MTARKTKRKSSQLTPKEYRKAKRELRKLFAKAEALQKACDVIADPKASMRKKLKAADFIEEGFVRGDWKLPQRPPKQGTMIQ